MGCGSWESGERICDELAVLAWTRLFFGEVGMTESFCGGDSFVWVDLQELSEKVQILL